MFHSIYKSSDKLTKSDYDKKFLILNLITLALILIIKPLYDIIIEVILIIL